MGVKGGSGRMCYIMTNVSFMRIHIVSYQLRINFVSNSSIGIHGTLTSVQVLSRIGAGRRMEKPVDTDALMNQCGDRKLQKKIIVH